METQKEYTNGEITVVWKQNLCVHAALCAKGLPKVFQPKEKPWIKPHQESTEAIIAQVNKCPSGALSFYKNAISD
jgi:uncharacterized Fe-S cluster protein YjdI